VGGTTSACTAGSADEFVSPTGSDSNPCTQAAPCATINRAYQVAAAGDLIQVAGGTYPAQTITRDSSKAAGPDVTIQSAAGATVTITGRLSLGSGGNAPSHVVVRNLTAPKQRVQITDPGSFITIQNVRAGSVYIDGAQHVLVKNSDFGNCSNTDPQCEGGGPGSQNWIKDDISSSRTVDITLDGVNIHDYHYDTNSQFHYECVFLLGGTNVTIQNSHFWNCELYDLFIQANGPFDISGVTLQNNWFGRAAQPTGVLRGSAVVIGQHNTSNLSNVLIRYNSFAPGEALLDEGFAFGDYTNVRAIGNIFGVDGNDTTNPSGGGGFTNCVPQITYDYNVWRSGSCGSHSRSLGGSMPYVNNSDTAAGDYHLAGAAGSTPADNFVAATGLDYSLGFDWDGQARVVPRDAGSDER
jgi:hypothetical protein